MELWLKIKERFISIYNGVNRLLFFINKNKYYLIPYVLMIYAVFCYFGFGSSFLVKNYTILRLTDTTLFVISFIHYTKNLHKYNKTTYNMFIGTFLFFILELSDNKLKFSDEVFLNCYQFIIIFTVLKSIYDNLNEDIKRHITK